MSLSLAITQLIESYEVIHERYQNPRRLREPLDDALSLLLSAQDLKCGYPVVLKFLHPLLEDPYWKAAFIREENFLFELQDQPYIVPIVEGLQELRLSFLTPNRQNFPVHLMFFTTQQAPSDLVTYLRSEYKHPFETLLLFKQLCQAVEQLHQRGICHRDIKPTNCVLFPGPNLRLIDFGFAYKIGSPRLAKGHQFAKRYAVPITDPRYMAFEFYCGFGRNPKFFFGGDIFALGVILFEMWTGKNLVNLFYDQELALDLAQLFYKFTNDEKREETYRKILTSLKRKWVLPHIRDFVSGPWLVGADCLNDLYSQLADLDYTHRCTDFTWIFKQLDKVMYQIMHN